MNLPCVYNKLTPAQKRQCRQAYVDKQLGCCYHCKEPLAGPPAFSVQMRSVKASLFPPGFFAHPVHLHHSHKTGLTIGAVHARCNAVLFQHYGE